MGISIESASSMGYGAPTGIGVQAVMRVDVEAATGVSLDSSGSASGSASGCEDFKITL